MALSSQVDHSTALHAVGMIAGCSRWQTAVHSNTVHTHRNCNRLDRRSNNSRNGAPCAYLLVRVGVLHLPVVGISNQPAEGQCCPGKLLPSEETRACPELLGLADI